jgi:hypothetical protein
MSSSSDKILLQMHCSNPNGRTHIHLYWVVYIQLLSFVCQLAHIRTICRYMYTVRARLDHEGGICILLALVVALELAAAIRERETMTLQLLASLTPPLVSPSTYVKTLTEVLVVTFDQRFMLKEGLHCTKGKSSLQYFHCSASWLWNI